MPEPINESEGLASTPKTEAEFSTREILLVEELTEAERVGRMTDELLNELLIKRKVAPEKIGSFIKAIRGDSALFKIVTDAKKNRDKPMELGKSWMRDENRGSTQAKLLELFGDKDNFLSVVLIFSISAKAIAPSLPIGLWEM